MKSLSTFKDVLRPSKPEHQAKPQLLDVYFAVYDALLDDDDDVRNEGASIVSYVLSRSASGIRIKTLAAASAFLEFLCINYANSKSLCIKATERMLGMKIRGTEAKDTEHSVTLHCEPASKLMGAAREEDHSLFAEEKQNLYRDDVQETHRMAQLLLSLQPSARDPVLVSLLRDWTLAGLETLVQTVTTEDQDGPLGWTSKPEVYTLGTRIITAAKVVTIWNLTGGRESQIERMVDSTKKFLEVGESRGIHGLWMKGAEMVVRVAEGQRTSRKAEE